jgi:hypothetical protein
MLNLRKALKLVSILNDSIPETWDLNAPIIDFVGKILENIVENNRHADYLASVELMTDISVDDLVNIPVDQVFQLFTDGLIENQILSLVDFYRSIGTKIWQTKPL